MISPHDPVETVLYEDLLDYTPFPRSVRLARYRMARLLWEWGYGHLVDDAELVVSELLTNAITHGRVPGRLVRVHLTVGKDVLRLSVSDARGELRPCVREPGDDASGGLGWCSSRNWPCGGAYGTGRSARPCGASWTSGGGGPPGAGRRG